MRILLNIMMACILLCSVKGNAESCRPQIKDMTIDFVKVDEVFGLPAELPNLAYPEIPPVLVDGKPDEFILSTGWSLMCRKNAGKNILTDKDFFDLNSNWQCTSGAIFGENWPSAIKQKDEFWRQAYLGVYNAHYLPIGKKSTIVAICHGENKNMLHWKDPNIVYDNTILPQQKYKVPEQYEYSDPNTKQWRAYWPAYFAFITMAHIADNHKNDPNNVIDLGPVIWPMNGYLSRDSKQISGGVRHPSTIVHDGYLYVYYIDASFGNGNIRAARCKIKDLNKPGGFKSLYRGKFDQPSLPAGFDIKDRRCFYKAGGKSSPLFPMNYLNRFSVAKIKGTDWFIGLEERITANETWPNTGLYLRLSDDLVNWTDGMRIPYPYPPDRWASPGLTYPIFFNENFTSSHEIDPNEFYIAGGWREDKPEWGKLPAMKLAIKIVLPFGKFEGN